MAAKKKPRKPRKQAKWERITPQRAEELLKTAINIRKPKPVWVRALAEMMRRGEWEENGATISISPEGKLLDGFSRCRACILAKMPFTSWVVYGVTSADETDHQMTRNAGDVLQNRYGHKQGKGVASVCRMIAGVRDAGSMSGAFDQRHCGFRRLIDTADERPQLDTIVLRVRSGGGDNVGATSVLSFVAWAAVKASMEKAQAFLSGIIEGVDVPRNSPILIVRNRLMADKRKRDQTSRQFAVGRHQLAFLLKAWNLHYNEQTPSRVRAWAVGELYPEMDGLDTEKL